ncbi:MAG TPA: tripartite tricarboxylate transporter TctB family protein [Afifellaceae bacterium]|nr:tripartite tricarboxylate transporter TctB family protein [Afifellaceae bacterium]
MRIGNVLPGALVLAVSAAVFVETRHLTYWSDTAPGAGFFPAWVISAGLVLFLLQLAEAWRSQHAIAQWPDGSALVRAGLTYGGLIALGLMAPVVGMLPSIVLFVLFLLIGILRRPIWPSLAATVITVGVIYVIFVSWLGIALPTWSIGI